MYRFTGDKDFYEDLIKCADEIAKEYDMKKLVDDVIEELAEKIKDSDI